MALLNQTTHLPRPLYHYLSYSSSLLLMSSMSSSSGQNFSTPLQLDYPSILDAPHQPWSIPFSVSYVHSIFWFIHMELKLKGLMQVGLITICGYTIMKVRKNLAF